MSALMITPLALIITTLLVVLCAALSLVLALGVQRQLLWAALRMMVQLLIVGLFLRQIFALSSAWLTGLVICAMLAAACYEVSARQERRLRGIWHYLNGAAPIVAATLGVALLALTLAPGAASAAPAPIVAWTYTVRPGDTMAGIAARMGVSPD